jgi:hypothetical protein
MKMAKNIFRVGVIGGRGSGNLSSEAPALHGLCRNVAAEMRAIEMDFLLLPVAAGVLACRRAGASRSAEKPFVRTRSFKDFNVVEKFGRFFPGGKTPAATTALRGC